MYTYTCIYIYIGTLGRELIAYTFHTCSLSVCQKVVINRRVIDIT